MMKSKKCNLLCSRLVLLLQQQANYYVVNLMLCIISLVGCTSCLVQNTSNPSGKHHRSYDAEYATRKERAAYWRERGYNFDPREISASRMDLYATHYDAAGWAGLLQRVREMNQPETKIPQESQVIQNVEKTIPPFIPPTPKASLNPTPRVIVPRAKPLPAIGP